MRDWESELTPDERRRWEVWVRHVREDTLRKMQDSAMVLSLVPSGEPDVKFAVELGLAILLDKPLVAIVTPGTSIPERLRRVADIVVEADVDTEAGQRAIKAALEQVGGD